MLYVAGHEHAGVVVSLNCEFCSVLKEKREKREKEKREKRKEKREKRKEKREKRKREMKKIARRTNLVISTPLHVHTGEYMDS